ncbi:MAG: hypothetical protein EBY21_01920 [Alphaproteobacteria bacterium]|nr:hypothetical protein [Alphaproteobacteria bacterium]
MTGQKGKKGQSPNRGHAPIEKAASKAPKPSREQGRLSFKSEPWYGAAWSKFSVSQNYKQEAQARLDLQNGALEE